MPNIKHLKHKEIDKKKWDLVVEKSHNFMVYAKSWYLDIVCPNWEALVENDYENVFPLAANQKYFINYLFQPFFTQQLGLFTKEPCTAEKLNEFLKKIPKKYRLIDICLNTKNNLEIENFENNERVNLELSLNISHTELKKNYSSNTKRNIKKAEKAEIEINQNVTGEQLISLFKNNRGKDLNFLETGYPKLNQIITESLKRKEGELFAAYTKENNELCGAAFFLHSGKKRIFLFSGNTEKAKKNGAMFLIIDNYIKQNSDKDLILDFEGSNNEGIARFYKGFGAEIQHYLHVKKTRFPFNLFK